MNHAHTPTPDLSRRSILGGAAALAGASLLPTSVRAHVHAQPAPASPSASAARLHRLAHLTDTHVNGEREAVKGVAQALAHAQSLAEKPEMILTGGDLIMDSMARDEAGVRAQWDLFTRVLKDHCSLPVRHCLGNHDVWGWDKAKSKSTGDEPRWGKRWAVEELGLTGAYHAFDLHTPSTSGPRSVPGPWRVIVLDSTFPSGSSYIARLDDEQHAWLESELASLAPDRHALIVSHIPIVTATALFEKREPINTGRAIPDSWMHVDAQRLRTLFLKHPQVRACVSGHMHLVDRVDLDGVRYFCNGAVSGNWWKGRHQTCDEGYATLDLFADGTVERTYHTFGWQAR
ncbi:MAG: metallophosphoesterase [Planctomycetota bacterium]|nr:metallophosphoesterase [Planctomycetota bacterium]